MTLQQILKPEAVETLQSAFNDPGCQCEACILAREIEELDRKIFRSVPPLPKGERNELLSRRNQLNRKLVHILKPVVA